MCKPLAIPRLCKPLGFLRFIRGNFDLTQTRRLAEECIKYTECDTYLLRLCQNNPTVRSALAESCKVLQSNGGRFGFGLICS